MRTHFGGRADEGLVHDPFVEGHVVQKDVGGVLDDQAIYFHHLRLGLTPYTPNELTLVQGRPDGVLAI